VSRYDVLLIGRNPVAAVLAHRLAEAGRSVALINDGMVSSTTAIVRWLTLRDLGIDAHAAASDWPAVARFIERWLLEDGSIDVVYRSDRLADRANRFLVTDSTQLTEMILIGSAPVDSGAADPVEFLWRRGRVTGARFADGSEVEARLTIVTSGNRLLLGATDRSLPDSVAPPFLEQIEITWAIPTGGNVERTRLAGGPLAAVGASATVVRLPDRIVLSLIAPAVELVREAIAVTDVLGNLLTHSALSYLPPVTAATSASVLLMALPPRVDLDQYGTGFAVLGAMEGLSDPGSFDREISVANQIAAGLTPAATERFGDVSLFGAVAGAVADLPWSRRDPRVPLRQADADWVLDDPDLLGRALARMARPSTFD
jgi:hypothetical protein